MKDTPISRRGFLGLAALTAMSATSLLAGCASGGASSSSSAAASAAASAASSAASSASATSSAAAPTDLGKTLVAYYSASGNTRAAAEEIATALGADTFEITPVDPYSTDDLNWTVDGSRVNMEHEDESLRDIALEQVTPDGFADYDTVILGYPIWWAIAAWPVDGFVSGNDFTGKTVIPFCTSTSSGIGQSGELLEELAGTGTWEEGHRFSGNAPADEVQAWAKSL